MKYNKMRKILRQLFFRCVWLTAQVFAFSPRAYMRKLSSPKSWYVVVLGVDLAVVLWRFIWSSKSWRWCLLDRMKIVWWTATKNRPLLFWWSAYSWKLIFWSNDFRFIRELEDCSYLEHFLCANTFCSHVCSIFKIQRRTITRLKDFSP